MRPARRFGARALVNENVGSLVNTLTLHKTSDLRLEAFARLLSEEWDVGIFIDFLNAQAMAVAVRGGAGQEGACVYSLAAALAGKGLHSGVRQPPLHAYACARPRARSPPRWLP